MEERDTLAAQLRLATASREAERARVEMVRFCSPWTTTEVLVATIHSLVLCFRAQVRSEARLDGQERIAQLEAALRRTELEYQVHTHAISSPLFPDLHSLNSSTLA